MADKAYLARYRRAVSIATVLVLISLAALFLGLVGRAIAEQQMILRHADHRIRAKDYARAALELARAKLENDIKFGSGSETVEFPRLDGDLGNAYGRIDFAKSAAYYSLNNSQNENNVMGSTNKMVPARCIHLVGEGRFGTVTYREEMVLGVPQFDYSLASSGRIETSGDFLLGALDDLSALSKIGSSEFEEKLKHGSLVSNSKDKPSVNLAGGQVRITGDITTPGTVSKAAQVKVDGLLQEGHRPIGLPKINIDEYDPEGKVQLMTTLTSPMIQNSIKGFARCKGDLVIDGPLNLDSGILYITGDLRVNGPVSGLGAVFCQKSVTFGSASVGSIKQMAIACKGDLTITGSGKRKSLLTGLLYSEGNLTLSDVTTVGAVVTNGLSGQVFKLNNVDAIKSKEGVAFSFEVGFSGPTEATITSSPTPQNPAGQKLLIRLKQVQDAKTKELRPARPSDFLDANGKTTLTPKGQDWELPDEKVNTIFEVLEEKTLLPAQPKASEVLPKNEKLQMVVAGVISATANTDNALTEKGQLNLDLNRFLRLSDRLKVLYRCVI